MASLAVHSLSTAGAVESGGLWHGHETAKVELSSVRLSHFFGAGTARAQGFSRFRQIP
jgi:hypothetical protein